MKRIIPILLTILLLFLTGCAQDSRAQVQTDLKDNAFAIVNGELVTQSEYLSFYYGNLAEMNQTQQELIEKYGEEEVIKYENDVLNDLVTQKVLLQYAAKNELGEISEDVKSQLKEKATQYLDSIKSELSSQITAEGTTGVLVNNSAELEKRYAGYLKKYGLNQEVVVNQLERQYIIEQVNKKIMEGFKLPDNAVQQYYDDALKQQQQYAESNPDEAMQNFLQGSNEVTVYVPDSVQGKARYVKHILITPPADYNEAIQTAETDGDEETVSRLKTEAMDEAKLLAEDVVKELDGGANFDELIEKYNQDPGVAQNPKGYLIYDGAPFVENFLNEGLALNKIGDYTSKPVETEYGYHIILYASDPVPGTVPLNEVESQILPLAETAARSEFWIEKVNAMVEEAQIEKVDMTINDVY